MDVAASEFFKDGKYDLDFKNKDSKPADWITSEALCEMYKGFVRDAPVVSIEDPFDQDDWAGWTKVNKMLDKINVLQCIIGNIFKPKYYTCTCLYKKCIILFLVDS